MASSKTQEVAELKNVVKPPPPRKPANSLSDGERVLRGTGGASCQGAAADGGLAPAA